MHEQVFHEDGEQKSSHGVQEMCIDEVTEEDMLHKLLEHEDLGHEKDSGGGGFI